MSGIKKEDEQKAVNNHSLIQELVL